MSTKILFFDAKPYDRTFFDHANEAHNYTIKYLNNRLSPDTVALCKGYDTVCAFVNDNLSGDVIDALTENGVRLIAMRCAGYNNVDLKRCYQRLHVVRVPAYSPYAVAEHALALMMTLNRKTHKASARTRDSNFSIHGLLGFDMFGKTAGVVGTGKIGRLMAEILRGLKMDVLAYDLYPNKEWAAQNHVRYVDLDDIYRDADVITLHCPLTPQNLHMINADNLAKMKDGVMIVNTGRGGLIDTRDLIAALKSHKVGAAGLDVYEEEDQYFFEDFSNEVINDDVLARLQTFPNVLITAHQAFFTREALTNIAETTLDNIKTFQDGGFLQNEICYQCPNKAACKKKEGKNCF